jgi:nicotinamidase/pyrazinamidase
MAILIDRQLPVFATRDWHPANHSSFIQQGGPGRNTALLIPKVQNLQSLCISLSPLILFQQELMLNRMVVRVLKTRHSSCNWIMQTPSVCSSADLPIDYCVLNTVRDVLIYPYQGVVVNRCHARR